MNAPHNPNDYSAVVEADRANVWHHLTQHKKFETADPLIIIEGKGMRVWNTARPRASRRGFRRRVDSQRRLWPREHCRCRPRPAGEDQLFRQSDGSIPGAHVLPNG